MPVADGESLEDILILVRVAANLYYDVAHFLRILPIRVGFWDLEQDARCLDVRGVVQ